MTGEGEGGREVLNKICLYYGVASVKGPCGGKGQRQIGLEGIWGCECVRECLVVGLQGEHPMRWVILGRAEGNQNREELGGGRRGPQKHSSLWGSGNWGSGSPTRVNPSSQGRFPGAVLELRQPGLVLKTGQQASQVKG